MVYRIVWIDSFSSLDLKWTELYKVMILTYCLNSESFIGKPERMWLHLFGLLVFLVLFMEYNIELAWKSIYIEGLFLFFSCAAWREKESKEKGIILLKGEVVFCVLPKVLLLFIFYNRAELAWAVIVNLCNHFFFCSIFSNSFLALLFAM